VKLLSRTLFSALLVATPVAAFAADITGAGATFPAPVYAQWGADYKAKTGNGLNYQGIGSGGGQTQITNRTVDFGASDAPMANDKLKSANLLQFPTVIGAVVPVYNVEGVDGLVLSGEVLADIYLGKITKWNDPKIAALNGSAKLPSASIVPVYRSDASGTSYVFTTYLASVSPAWKSDVGAATSVQWPAGAGAKGNDGIAGTVKNTAGSVGYVEYVYAANNNLDSAKLVNQAGKTVEPTAESFKAAAAAADWDKAENFAASMINTADAAAWPIVSATFILLPKNPTDAARSAEVMKFFDWAYKDGAAAADKLHYISLPAAVTDRVRAAWKADVKDSGGKAVWQ
jgi:phosphate transport system substrate-binding protein